MDRAEARLAVAKARQRQRAVEREIRRIREESRSYQRLGFGQDIKDIQLSALQDQRLRYQAEARRLQRFVTAQPARAVSLQGWFLLPIVWLLLVLSTLARLPGRGAPARERRTVPSERPVRY